MRLAKSISFDPHGPGGLPLASRVAALDLGGKTFNAVLGEIQGERIVTRPLEKRQLSLGMHAAISRGVIGREKLSETSRALAELKSICEREGSTDILAVATRAVRSARNGPEIIHTARELGFAVDIATGEREAELAYLAVTGGKPGKLVCGLGSHSMQLAWRASAHIETISVAVGYQRAYLDYIRDARYFAQAHHAYAAFLDGEIRGLPFRNGQFIAIAMNAVACFVTGQQKSQVSDRYLSHTCIREKMRALGALTRTEFTTLKAATPKADEVFSSLILLDRLLKRTGHGWVYVAKSELPVGLIIDYFEGAATR